MIGEWLDIGWLHQIPLRGARTIPVEGGEEIAVFRTSDNRVFALANRCPHKGGPLSQGIVFGDSVACPLHNWTIGLGSGCATAPDVGCVQTFSVKVEAGVVSLDLNEINAPVPDLGKANVGGNDAAGTAPGARSY